MAQNKTTIGSKINAAIQAAKQGIDMAEKSWGYISGAHGLLMYPHLSAWRYGVGWGWGQASKPTSLVGWCFLACCLQ